MSNFRLPTSPIAQKLLAVIQDAAPAWLSRVEIAERIGKEFLNGYADSRLEILINRGFIRARKISRPGGHPYTEYQAIIEDRHGEL